MILGTEKDTLQHYYCMWRLVNYYRYCTSCSNLRRRQQICIHRFTQPSTRTTCNSRPILTEGYRLEIRHRTPLPDLKISKTSHRPHRQTFTPLHTAHRPLPRIEPTCKFIDSMYHLNNDPCVGNLYQGPSSSISRHKTPQPHRSGKTCTYLVVPITVTQARLCSLPRVFYNITLSLDRQAFYPRLLCETRPDRQSHKTR
jgi:hypothetical protein